MSSTPPQGGSEPARPPLPPPNGTNGNGNRTVPRSPRVALEPERYDCVVIATDHHSIDYEELVHRAHYATLANESL